MCHNSAIAAACSRIITVATPRGPGHTGYGRLNGNPRHYTVIQRGESFCAAFSRSLGRTHPSLISKAVFAEKTGRAHFLCRRGRASPLGAWESCLPSSPVVASLFITASTIARIGRREQRKKKKVKRGSFAAFIYTHIIPIIWTVSVRHCCCHCVVCGIIFVLQYVVSGVFRKGAVGRSCLCFTWAVK